MDGRLSYSMPAATDLIPGTTIDNFKAFDSVQMTTQVQNSETGDVLACSDDACNLQYSWDYTPIWYYTSPAVTYSGQKMNVYFNPMQTPNYKNSDEVPFEFKLDDQRINVTDTISTSSTLSKNTFQNIRGTVTTKARNQDVDFSVEFSGAGKALKNGASADTCLLDGSCYTMKILPSIQGVSAS